MMRADIDIGGTKVRIGLTVAEGTARLRGLLGKR